MKKSTKFITIISLAGLFAGCTSSEPRISHTPNFQAGQADGCETAKGNYTKNSESFKQDQEYHNGWFYGRKHCNPLN